ncbi:hypothetical protein PCE1_003387 [Barthelona sp. PCE]
MPRCINREIVIKEDLVYTPNGKDRFKIEKVDRKPINQATFPFDEDGIPLAIDINSCPVVYENVKKTLGKGHYHSSLNRCLFDTKTFYIVKKERFSPRETINVMFFEQEGDDIVFTDMESFEYSGSERINFHFLDRNTTISKMPNDFLIINWIDGVIHSTKSIHRLDNLNHCIINRCLLVLCDEALRAYSMDDLTLDQFTEIPIEENEHLVCWVGETIHPNAAYLVSYPEHDICHLGIIYYTVTEDKCKILWLHELFPQIMDLSNGLCNIRVWHLSVELLELTMTFQIHSMTLLCVIKEGEMKEFQFHFPQTVITNIPPFSPEINHLRYLEECFGTLNNSILKYNKFFVLKDRCLECSNFNTDFICAFPNCAVFNSKLGIFGFNFYENIVFYEKRSFNKFHYTTRSVNKLKDHISVSMRFGCLSSAGEDQIIDPSTFNLQENEFNSIRLKLPQCVNLLQMKEKDLLWYAERWDDDDNNEIINIFITSLETGCTVKIIDMLSQGRLSLVHYDERNIILRHQTRTQQYCLNDEGIWELKLEVLGTAHFNPFLMDLSISATKGGHVHVRDSTQDLSVQAKIGKFIMFLAPRLVLFDVGIFRITKRCRLTKLVDFDGFTVDERNCHLSHNSVSICAVSNYIINRHRYEFNDTHIIDTEVVQLSLSDWLQQADIVKVDFFRDIDEESCSDDIIELTVE